MEDLFRSYWWLLFPLGFFIFGAWDRWLAYRRSQDRLDLLRSYTSQGRDPPPELLRALQDEEAIDPPPPPPPYGMYGRHARRYYRWMRRSSPYWAWRSAVVTGAVAVGFWFASEYAEIPGTYEAFRVVAVILSCVAVARVITALFATTFRER